MLEMAIFFDYMGFFKVCCLDLGIGCSGQAADSLWWDFWWSFGFILFFWNEKFELSTRQLIGKRSRATVQLGELTLYFIELMK